MEVRGQAVARLLLRRVPQKAGGRGESVSNETRHVKHLRALRQSLRDYGVDKDEGLKAAVDRLIREHREALQQAAEAKAEALRASAEAELARRTRDLAQAASNRDVQKARDAEEDRQAVLNAFNILVRLVPPADQVSLAVKIAGPRMARTVLRGGSVEGAAEPKPDEPGVPHA